MNIIPLLIFVTFVSAYRDYSKISNAVDKCICYFRKKTLYYSETCNQNLLNSVTNVVAEICRNISYCTDAYAYSDDSCPKALWSYGTYSCRDACGIEMQNALIERNVFKNHYLCVASIAGSNSHYFYCNRNGWESLRNLNNITIYSCNGWKL